MSRLQQHYREKVVPQLTEKFGYKSPMQVPRITKITLNMGVSEAVADKKVMDHAVSDLTKISGQNPVVTQAKKAIAGFKIREGQAIGTMVTLRGARMYEFLDRFVTVALPRVRDFRGVSARAFDGRGNYNIGVKEQIIFPEIEYDKVDTLRGLRMFDYQDRFVTISLPRVRDFRGVSARAFDGRGNYNIGVKEQIIFPEIEYDKVDAIRGLNISITTTAKTDDECKALLAGFRFPFKN
jgi:large subunit ribosomal protein L5